MIVSNRSTRLLLSDNNGAVSLVITLITLGNVFVVNGLGASLIHQK